MSDRTVRRAIKAGELPARQVPFPGTPTGWRWELDEQDVQRWGVERGLDNSRSGLTAPADADEQGEGALAARVQALERENSYLREEIGWLRVTVDRVLTALPAARQPLQVPMDESGGAGEREVDSLRGELEGRGGKVEHERSYRAWWPFSWVWRRKRKGWGEVG